MNPREAPKTGQILLYFGVLTLLVYLVTPSGYLLDISSSFMLKDQLHASADRVSAFRLLTGTPIYLAFIFGLVRDRWSPLGLRDRGFLMIFTPATAAAFAWMAFAHLTYAGLLAGMLLSMVSFRFSAAAYQGLTALIGQEALMTGRLSVLWNIFSIVPSIVGGFGSGYVADHFSSRQTFLLMAALAVLLSGMGSLKPRAVFGRAYDEPQARASTFAADVKRLTAHRAIYPAILINLLFSFAPGSNTPLQFYLTNQLHASDAAYANYTAIFAASFIPTLLLYGYLCRKVALNKLLWWGTAVAIPQTVPLAFIHSADLAVILAVPIGLMGGIASAAYIDLAMRSCPAGLQGTLMMLVDGVLALALRGGDMVGSWLYSSSPAHGFLYCVIATTAVYTLILPLIALVPRDLIATADGQPAESAG